MRFIRVLCCVAVVAALVPVSWFAMYRPASGISDAFEPDNTTASAQVVTDTGLPLVQDRAVGSAAPARADWDYYKVVGTTNTLYTFETSGTADTLLEVRDGVTNQVLGWSDDKDDGTFGSKAYWRCTSSGKSVYVRVGPANSSTGAGAYKMSITRRAATRRTADVHRVYGANKYAAAVNQAKDVYRSDSGSPWHYYSENGSLRNVSHVWVVSTSGAAQTSAMCVQPLASIYSGPVLLVTKGTLPSATSSAIRAIRSNNGGKVKIHVLGPTGWISSSVYRRLKALKGTHGTIERISAADRYALAAKIADRVDSAWVTNMGEHPRAVLVANGSKSAALTDLTVASGLGYSMGWPILLTRSTSAPTATTSRIRTKFKRAKVYAANSTTYLNTATYKKVSGDVRLSTHSDRSKSALDVARYGLANHWFHHEDVVVVNRISEALTVGTYAGAYRSVVLVSGTSGPYSTTRSYFTMRPSMIDFVSIAGSTAGISNAAIGAYKSASK